MKEAKVKSNKLTREKSACEKKAGPAGGCQLELELEKFDDGEKDGRHELPGFAEDGENAADNCGEYT